MKSQVVAVALLLNVGCATERIQVFNTDAMPKSLAPEQWVFEADSVVVSYSFYASQGVMAFSVYNTSSRPLYIDWKRSSFIHNGAKYDYWVDELVSESNSTIAMQSVGLQTFDWGWTRPMRITSTLGNASVATTSFSKRAERVAFIPPRSYLDQAKFKLHPNDQFMFNADQLALDAEPRSNRPSATTVVTTQTFGPDTSPVRFRNYLAVARDEEVTDPKFIDHEFWVSSIKEMELRHFRGKLSGYDANGERIYPRPFKTNKSLYIKLRVNAPVSETGPSSPLP
ncbi:MAG: hypothetical protein WAU70_04870 [Flavobacteriales bacterium]